jgi:hypothetical protein
MPPVSTATARIPNATQPQSVLLSDSALFDAAAAPAAAAAAGFTPVVVVEVVVEGAAATVTVSVSLWVWVFVTVTALVVVTASVSVTVAAGAAGRVVVSAGVVVGVVSVFVVVGVCVLRAGVVRVSVGSVAVTPVESATPSPPHPAATKTTRPAANPAIPVRLTVRP